MQKRQLSDAACIFGAMGKAVNSNEALKSSGIDHFPCLAH